MKTICIVNPAAAGGRTRHRIPAVERSLRRAFEDFELVTTEGPGHATVLCRDALERGVELVIAVGGDGTANEVLCGFVDRDGVNRFPEAVMGVVASGTGGDFVRHLGAASLEAQLTAVSSGGEHWVDYGVARLVSSDGRDITRPFLNEASVGLSGLVVDLARRAPRMLGPTSRYLLSSLRGLLEYREKGVTLVFDDGVPREMPLRLAVVGNGQYFGGGMKITPEAVCDDGWFDVVYTGGVSKLHFAGLLARVFNGRHVESDTVATLRTRTVRMMPTSERDVILIDVDGEQPGRLPASFTVVPGGIQLRAAGLPARAGPSSGRFKPVEPAPQRPEDHRRGKLLH